MDIQEKLLNLESGDYIDYNQLIKQLEQLETTHEIKSLYHDSVGFLESWRIGEYGEIVIDAMNGEPMIRKTQNIEKELETEVVE